MKTLNYTRKVKFSSTNNYRCGPANEDDVYTIAEWLDHVKNGSFVDYDGYGYFVKDSLANEHHYVKPSQGENDAFETYDATHIIWFNR